METIGFIPNSIYWLGNKLLKGLEQLHDVASPLNKTVNYFTVLFTRDATRSDFPTLFLERTLPVFEKTQKTPE